LKFPSFCNGDFSNVQAHDNSPHVRVTSMSTRGSLYNMYIRIAQELL
jgi:hypothetical protein